MLSVKLSLLMVLHTLSVIICRFWVYSTLLLNLVIFHQAVICENRFLHGFKYPWAQLDDRVLSDLADLIEWRDL